MKNISRQAQTKAVHGHQVSSSMVLKEMLHTERELATSITGAQGRVVHYETNGCLYLPDLILMSVTYKLIHFF